MAKDPRRMARVRRVALPVGFGQIVGHSTPATRAATSSSVPDPSITRKRG
jgi:hypothetical protein